MVTTSESPPSPESPYVTGSNGPRPPSFDKGAGSGRARPSFRSIPAHGHRHRLRVGLLGGSFNPAHSGHRHVAELALTRLRLDQVWLLVSPGNPLKPIAGMAEPAARLTSARAVAGGRRIIATDIERRLGTRYTVDTLRALHRRFPNVDFVWLMGADNLTQLPRWRRWRDIVATTAIAVLPRPTYNHRALAGHAAKLLRGRRLAAHEGPGLAHATPPAWVFLPTAQHPASASAIRASISPPVPPASTPPTLLPGV